MCLSRRKFCYCEVYVSHLCTGISYVRNTQLVMMPVTVEAVCHVLIPSSTLWLLVTSLILQNVDEYVLVMRAPVCCCDYACDEVFVHVSFTALICESAKTSASYLSGFFFFFHFCVMDLDLFLNHGLIPPAEFS